MGRVPVEQFGRQHLLRGGPDGLAGHHGDPRLQGGAGRRRGGHKQGGSTQADRKAVAEAHDLGHKGVQGSRFCRHGGGRGGRASAQAHKRKQPARRRGHHTDGTAAKPCASTESLSLAHDLSRTITLRDSVGKRHLRMYVDLLRMPRKPSISGCILSYATKATTPDAKAQAVGGSRLQRFLRPSRVCAFPAAFRSLAAFLAGAPMHARMQSHAGALACADDAA
jgi:hypothetical protein